MSEVINNIRRDANDGLLFLRETLFVHWRINPVATSVVGFTEVLNEIDESTDNSRRSALFGEAISSIELQEFIEFEKGFLDSVKGTVGAYSKDVTEVPIRVYPDTRKFVVSALASAPDIDVGFYCGQIQKAIKAQKASYNGLHRHFQQLQEFYPRYSNIMDDSLAEDLLIGFTAGFFGGGLGGVAAEVWDGWSNCSDEEFIQKFGSAADDYIQRSNDFTDGGESALVMVFDRLFDEFEETNECLFKVYESLEEDGLDMQPIYLEHRKVPPDLYDEEGVSDFIELVIQNLSENRSIPSRRVRNIREIIGLPPKMDSSSDEQLALPPILEKPLANYSFIGGDGKTYGPYSAEQMHQCLAQNRLNGQSQVSANGGPMQPASLFPEIVGGGSPSPAEQLSLPPILERE